MKATELMINDWVLVHKTPQQVAVIEETCISYWAELPMSTELLSPSLSGIEPIPLTPEILEKNGWIFMEGQDYSTFPVPSKWTYQFVPFVLRVDGETYSIANTFTIKYVHELQHALRLCGLDELADNFKIE